MKLVTNLQRIALAYPKSVILFFLICTGLAILMLPRLTQNPNPWLIGPSHESRVNFEKLKETYTGSRDSIFVLLEAEKTVFNPSTLQRIKNLTEEFEEIELVQEKDCKELEAFAKKLAGEKKEQLLALLESGINKDSWDEFESFQASIENTELLTPQASQLFKRVSVRITPIIEVTSLSNTDNILSIDGGLDINPVYDEVPESQEELDLIRKSVLDNDLFLDTLVMKDGKLSAIIVENAIEEGDSASRYLLHEQIKNILDNKFPGKEKYYLAGIPVYTAVISNSIDTDSQRLFPIVLLIVLMCLFFIFRTFKGILVPILVVVLTLVVTLAIQALTKIPINVISTALPVFILSIGVADGIHLFSEYRDHILEGKDKREVVELVIHDLSFPVVMTSVTTAGAFIALSITEVIQLKHFGWFVAIGTIVAMIFSLVFVPAMLLVLPQSAMKKTKKNSKVDELINQFLEKLSIVAVKKKKAVIVLFSILAVLCVIGLREVNVDNDVITYFKDDADIVIATNKMNKDTAGSIALNLTVTPIENESEPLKKPENLIAIAKLSEHLEKHPLVGKVNGLTKLLNRINLVLHDNNPAYNTLPLEQDSSESGSPDENDTKETLTGKQVISQYLLLYENSGDMLPDVVTSDYTQTNLSIMLKSSSSKETTKIIKYVDDWAATNLPPNLTYQFSGSSHVMAMALKEIVEGQINSFIVSMALVLTLMVLTFRSFQVGFIAIIPLVFTILFNFGVMGLFKITLDAGTVVVSSIVIGVGVDYAIHYLNRLKNNLRNGMPHEEAVLGTVKFCGKAIIASAVTVAAGFVALLFSVVTALSTAGWLILMTMMVSAICTITLLPALTGLLGAAAFTKEESEKVLKPQTL